MKARRALLLLCLIGCSARPQSRTAELRGNEALVVREGQLQAIALADGAAQPILETNAAQCLADARLQAAFLLEKMSGRQRYQIRVVDLRGGEDFVVAEGLPRVDLLVVEHAGMGAVNPPSTMPHRMAAVLRLGPEPELLGRASHKAEDGPLPGTLATLAQRVDEVEVQRVDQLRSLIRRAGRRGIWHPPPKVPQPPRVRVPLEDCFEPTRCEVATVLPGTPYWMVVTQNEKTAIYQKTLSHREFFDPRSGEFFDPATGRRSERPLGAHLERLLVAPSGAAMMRYGAVIDFERGVLVDGALPCGFIDGGWIVGGWPFR